MYEQVEVDLQLKLKILHIECCYFFHVNNIPYVRRVRQADFVDGVEETVDWGVMCRDDKLEVMVFEKDRVKFMKMKRFLNLTSAGDGMVRLKV